MVVIMFLLLENVKLKVLANTRVSSVTSAPEQIFSSRGEKAVRSFVVGPDAILSLADICSLHRLRTCFMLHLGHCPKFPLGRTSSLHLQLEHTRYESKYDTPMIVAFSM